MTSSVPIRYSIRAQLISGFAGMGLVVAVLGGYGVHTLGLSEHIVRDTYDRPLMAINFARAANLDFSEMRHSLLGNAEGSTELAAAERFRKFSQDFTEDMSIAESRSVTERERSLAHSISQQVGVWSAQRVNGNPGPEVTAGGDRISQDFERLIEYTAESGFHERQLALDMISRWRLLAGIEVTFALAITLAIALALGHRLARPITSAAAIARRISAGDLDTAIPTGGRDETGDLLCSLATMQDSIRAMVAAEQAEKRRAEQACEIKSRSLANMSHELRTPLNAIIGFSEIISNELFGRVGNAKYLEYSADILKSGRHLLSVINTVLVFAKSEANKMELGLEPVSLGEIIDECTRMVREQCVHAELTLDIGRGDATVLADATKMRQIFLNLLSNAIKFSPPGGRVSVRVACTGTGDVLIEVTDTGIGMKPEDIPVALAPFGQVDNSLSRRYPGTGLGLPLTKVLVEAHKGKLEIESALCLGTTVRVRMPVASTEAAVRDIAARATNRMVELAA